jgi:uncharacterized protein YegP (UPF0339 family)
MTPIPTSKPRKAATPRPRYYVVFLSKKGEGWWRRKVNGRTVATCHEGYSSGSPRGAMNAAARAAKKDAGTMDYRIYFEEA